MTIVVDHLSKEYRAEREQYRALRDVLARGGRSGRSGAMRKALDDVSFRVETGEVLGVVGGNGAGKSTLFKVLSRVAAPTSGEVRISGRVGALLEVGTGFHPELTGRENVYLNGAILGMTRREIAGRFDEIVDFSEISASIDQQVKQYSVGMYMRLAFAVAAHLEPDVLLIDEVLAVGDARFQEKCLTRVRELGQSGRTVLFISHQLETVRQLCDRCVLLRRGTLVGEGDPAAVIAEYLQDDAGVLPFGSRVDTTRSARAGSGEARIEWLELEPDAAQLRAGGSIRLRLGVRCERPVLVRSVGVSVHSEAGTLLVDVDSRRQLDPLELEVGTSEIDVQLGPLPLGGGRYRLSVRLANPITNRLGSGAVDHLDTVGFLNVDVDPRGDSAGPVSVPASFRPHPGALPARPSVS